MCAFSAVLTTPAHSPEQPAVVSDLSLHERSRRAHLHHQCSTTTSDTIFYIAPSSCVRGALISASLDAWLRPSRTSQPDTRTMIKYSRRTDTNRDLASTRRQRQIAVHQPLRVLKRYKRVPCTNTPTTLRNKPSERLTRV